MKPAVIGFDTSNYRTSVAAVTLEGEILLNWRELLPVPLGERGLRQSEAVFAHLRGLRKAQDALRKATRGLEIRAVAASVRPRDPEESYMPVFMAGTETAGALAAVLQVPFIETTHQRGHLAAAARGTPLAGADHYLAVHLSGGTTDLLHLEGERLTQIGGSLDLHAGPWGCRFRRDRTWRSSRRTEDARGGWDAAWSAMISGAISAALNPGFKG